MKRSWQLQDAKNQLSRVVAEAKEHGPQTITVHGRPAVVVIAIEEFRCLSVEKKPLSQFFRELAPKGPGLKTNRSRDRGRRIEL
ncbi:MAG: type II toxin-antitoxin system Phd/YefM family antitoxin [Acidiferrobacteraceae bacterium]